MRRCDALIYREFELLPGAKGLTVVRQFREEQRPLAENSDSRLYFGVLLARARFLFRNWGVGKVCRVRVILSTGYTTANKCEKDCDRKEGPPT